jgi:BMFP domain-containing protein YqiC
MLEVCECANATVRRFDSDADLQYYAFMNALAFIHGTNAWPYRIEYWRAGRKITDQITAASRLAKTSHTAWSIEIGKAQWNYPDTVKKVAAFFETNSNLSKEISNILFLFREADYRVHSEITTIAMCALFENLVQILFRERKLPKTEKMIKTKELFQKAKAEVCEQIGQQISTKGEGYERLHKMVSDAHPFEIRAMSQAVFESLDLVWSDEIETIFEIWKNARNDLFHYKSRAMRSDDKWKKILEDESRIAGLINILLLKLFGYSGQMRCSAIEEKYRQI